jgi:hypothetical protein
MEIWEAPPIKICPCKHRKLFRCATSPCGCPKSVVEHQLENNIRLDLPDELFDEPVRTQLLKQLSKW